MTFDPGLQAQRTTLAWTRTGVAAGVLAALLLRGAVHSGGLLATAAAVAGALGAVAVLGAGSRAVRPLRRLPGPERPCDHRGVRAVTGLVLTVGLLTLGSLLVS